MSSLVIGIDEVGYGSWAGPLVIGGVVLPKEWDHDLCRDSKDLTEKQRAAALDELDTEWFGAVVAGMEAVDVDQLGVSVARQQLTSHVAQLLGERFPGAIVVQDGDVPAPVPGRDNTNMIWMPGADAQVPAVSAASILAKVTRDGDMTEYAQVFPGYAFESNKGYHSVDHVAGLEQYGPCPIHRFSYRPIQKYMVSSVTWQSPRRKTGINVWTSYPRQ